MSWVGKFYGYKALRTHPTPFILFSFLKRLSLWTDITCFLRTNIDTNTLHIFWVIVWMNTKCNSQCWLKTFCISKRKSWGCGILFPALNTHMDMGKKDINVYFLLLCRPTPFTVSVNTFNFSWPHLNWRQNNSCPILKLLCCSQAEFFFQGLLINLLLPLFAEWTMLHVWASTINSYLFSRPTMSSPFVLIRLNVKVNFFLANTMKACGSVQVYIHLYWTPTMNGSKSFSNMTGNFDRGQGPV